MQDTLRGVWKSDINQILPIFEALSKQEQALQVWNLAQIS
jgi:hypothetical protein